MAPRTTKTETKDYEAEGGALTQILPGRWVELEGTGVEIMLDPMGGFRVKYRKGFVDGANAS